VLPLAAAAQQDRPTTRRPPHHRQRRRRSPYSTAPIRSCPSGCACAASSANGSRVPNLGFTEGRDDGYALSRFRFNVTVTPNKYLSFQTNLQDARVGGKTVGPTTAPFRGPFDVRTLFADVGTAKAPVAARLGRQELAFGEQRLLGHLAWVNTGRSWDAARAILRHKTFQVDVFAASLVRSLPDGFDKSGNGNRLVAPTPHREAASEGDGGTLRLRAARREPDERTRPLRSIDQTTVGARTAGKLPLGLDYGVEMALQRGSLADDSISAWAGHYQMRESLPGAGAIKLTSEYNFATGDKNPTDGTRATFDQLYPTGHDKLGLSDQVGWRNTHHLRAGFEFSPLKATPISVNYQTWWLAEKTDGLYAANGNRIAFVAGGAASSHVGQELDVQVTRALTPQLQLAAGYAHMFAGDFLKQATPGKSYSYPYVMATYVFLADK
jgi:hypothetical protein